MYVDRSGGGKIAAMLQQPYEKRKNDRYYLCCWGCLCGEVEVGEDGCSSELILTTLCAPLRAVEHSSLCVADVTSVDYGARMPGLK